MFKKINICINSTFIFNINSMEYYLRFVKDNLNEEYSKNYSFNFEKDFLNFDKDIYIFKPYKKHKKHENNNILKKITAENIFNKNKIFLNDSKEEINTTTDYENINNCVVKKKKIDCVFNEDLIFICDKIINISKLLNLKDSVKNTENIKYFFKNNKILKYNVEIFKICEEINNKIDNFKKKEIKEITNLEINSIINNLKKIKEIINNNNINK